MTQLPPGPGFGALQTIQYIRNPYPMLRRLARRYGDVFRVRAGVWCVMTGRPALVRRIISAPSDQYGLIKRHGAKRIFGEAGLTTLEGRALRRDRKLIMPNFQEPVLSGLAGMMRAATLEALAGWQPGGEVTMRQAALGIALDVILRTVFGAESPTLRAAFREAVRRFSEAFGNPLFLTLTALRLDHDALPPFRRYSAARAALQAMLGEAIRQARAAGAGRGDILGRLVAARYDDGTAMSDAALTDNLIATLVAGHETSVVSLCWAMFWLHHHPGCRERVLAELDALGDGAEPGAVAALPYLDAVVKETLRLWPVVSDIIRVLARPMELGGYTLPAGTVVAASAAILHYDPEVFPEPDTFRPERFLERSFAAHEYIPFGGGERMCPGAQFSSFELKVILTTLLSHGRFRLLEDGVPPVQRVGFLMAPRSGVRLRYEGPRR